MKDLRGPLPLVDRDFVEIRKNVLSKIGRRHIAPLALRLAAVAAALVVLVVVLVPHPKTTPSKRPVQVVMPPTPAIRVAVSPATPPPPTPPTPKRRKAEHMVASGGPPQDSDIYMNLQTSDPNVRIIWIARR